MGAAWEGSWLVPRAQSSLFIYAVAVLRIVRRRLTQHFDEGSGERRHLLSLLLIFPARTLKPRIPDSKSGLSFIHGAIKTYIYKCICRQWYLISYLKFFEAQIVILRGGSHHSTETFRRSLKFSAIQMCMFFHLWELDNVFNILVGSQILNLNSLFSRSAGQILRRLLYFRAFGNISAKILKEEYF